MDPWTRDAILHRLIDEDEGIERTATSLEVDESLVRRLASQHVRSRHTRRYPPSPASTRAGAYDRFHEIMAEESSQTLLPILREQVLALVPGLVERLEEGIRVADLGCGQGQALNLMAGWFPNSEFIGYDLSEEAIESARKQAAGLELSNVAFLVRDLSTFDEDAERSAYDFVTTFDAIHDQARPAALLRGIARSLTDDGVYLAQDINGSRHLHNNIDHPLATVLYTVSCMHCMTVSLAQGGEGLGTMWGWETAVEMLEEAGFGDVEVHEFEEDIQNCFFVCSLG
ncbi:MAG: class I SAM-dependent methyltransferase [Persicimonas sp.]